MGYVGLGLCYVVGGLLLGAGIYLVLTADFPGWWRRRLLWPLVRVTPRVVRAHGLAAIGVGASVIALGFSTIVPEVAGGLLVLFAVAAYLAGLVSFLLSTWLSRRPV